MRVLISHVQFYCDLSKTSKKILSVAKHENVGKTSDGISNIYPTYW